MTDLQPATIQQKMNAIKITKSPGTEYDPRYFGTRMFALYLVAISGSLGTAISAIGRLTLYACALILLIRDMVQHQRTKKLRIGGFTACILVAIAYLALSILWTSVELPGALQSWARQARILTIPLMYFLIRDREEGKAVLRVFVVAQIFVVFSSWLLVLGVPVPWATAHGATTTYAVFGSYLEQSISQAILVGVLWFTRTWIFGKRGQLVAIAIALITLLLTVGFLKGRSGHAALIGIVTLIVVNELPRKFKWAAIFAPLLVLALTVTVSANFRERLQLVRSEVTSYSQNPVAGSETSSGLRLKFWTASLKAFAEKPVFGYGVGSWKIAFSEMEHLGKPEAALTDVDPHQMFLLWAVEGGLTGLVLHCTILALLLLHSRKLQEQDARNLQAVLLGLVISGMFNSMLIGIGMGDYFCILIGILVAMESGGQPVYERASRAAN